MPPRASRAGTPKPGRSWPPTVSSSWRKAAASLPAPESVAPVASASTTYSVTPNRSRVVIADPSGIAMEEIAAAAVIVTGSVAAPSLTESSTT